MRASFAAEYRRRTKRILLTHFLLVLSAFCCFADPIRNPQSAIRNPQSEIDVADVGRPAFRIFTDRDGLPQNAITAMAFDRKGYLWIGTKDGVAYYNGRKWTVVDMPDRRVSNTIISMLVALDGSIWFGKQDGVLLRLKNGEWTTFDAKSGLPNYAVKSLLETVSQDGARTLWVGTLGGGLARFLN